jgi:hypothetical protein
MATIYFLDFQTFLRVFDSMLITAAIPTDNTQGLNQPGSNFRQGRCDRWIHEGDLFRYLLHRNLFGQEQKGTSHTRCLVSFCGGPNKNEHLKRFPFLPDFPVDGPLFSTLSMIQMTE